MKPLAKRKAARNSKYWQNKSMALWRELVVWKWGGKCAVNNFVSKCAGPLQAHHLITRSVKHLQHSVENGVCLCAKHHIFCHKLSAHGAPMAFSQWFHDAFPERWEWVDQNKWTVKPPDAQADYERLLGMRK